MKRLWSGLILALCVPVSWAATTLNLKDADINTLITTVSEVTGKNFIVDEKVKGKVTVISSKPMSSDAVYETFLAVLSIKGFAAVPAGAVIKIVQDTNARSDGGARIADGHGLPDDDVVTHVYEIQNVSAAQLVPILRPLVPQWGHLVAYAPSNMLIISDRASNVVRLEKLIQQIDRTGDREIELIKLQNAGAADVVRILTSLTQQDKQADPAVRPAMVIADERSNSILIGGDKSERQKLIDIVTQLDIPLTEDGATQVVYLNYASAENLAPILEGYAQQADAANTKPGGAIPQNVAAGGGGGFDGKTRILADKDSNALVITGSPKSMKAVRNVIAQLDIKRAQVLVEAMVAEVSTSASSALGLDWAVFNPQRIALAGILDPATISAAATLAAGSTAVAQASATGNSPLNSLTGVVGGAGRIVNDGKSGTSFAILLKALQGDGDTNVLSTPTIVATDNEESKLTVGSELSVPTGSYSTAGTSGTTTLSNPFITNTQKTVGLILSLTPQVNEGDSVKLKLSLEVSSPAAGSGPAGTSAQVFNKRNIETTVTVDSGQILVLGGLIDDQTQDTVRGIPFLSKLPLFGGLFQSRETNKQKRNLMVFIRPAILRTDQEGDYYTRRKYDAVRQTQIDQINRPRSSLLPRPGSSVLPRYDDLQKDKPAPPRTPPTKAPASEYEPAPTPTPAPQGAPASPKPGTAPRTPPPPGQAQEPEQAPRP
jgi:general secretion pathway protein D